MSPRGIAVFFVHVADIPTAELAVYSTWLAPEEHRQHERMATAALRDEYLVTRALSRSVLSRYAPDVHPSAWRFERTEAGRPFVVGPRAAPSFNLSHADGMIVCAAGTEAVGVDVEPLGRGAELLPNAARIFSPSENASLAALPEADRARRAVELWTVKEAYLKGRGDGISVRLDRFSVGASTSTRYVLEDVDALADDPAEWQIEVRHLPFRDGYVVAVAVRRGHEEDAALTITSVVPA